MKTHFKLKINLNNYLVKLHKLKSPWEYNAYIQKNTRCDIL